MRKFFSGIFFLVLVLGCSQFQETSDSINPKSILVNESCLDRAKRYYKRFGYSVSNYFEFTSIEAKDLNDDGVTDSIAILSPLELIPEFETCHKQSINTAESRLLLINLMNPDGTISKRFRYDKVISNEPTSRTKSGAEYIDVSTEQPGLTLYQDYGQGCYAQYYIHIGYLKKEREFEIDSIVFKNFCPGRDTVEYVEQYPIQARPFYLKDYSRALVAPFKREFGVVE